MSSVLSRMIQRTREPSATVRPVLAPRYSPSRSAGLDSDSSLSEQVVTRPALQPPMHPRGPDSSTAAWPSPSREALTAQPDSVGSVTAPDTSTLSPQMLDSSRVRPRVSADPLQGNRDLHFSRDESGAHLPQMQAPPPMKESSTATDRTRKISPRLVTVSTVVAKPVAAASPGREGTLRPAAGSPHSKGKSDSNTLGRQKAPARPVEVSVSIGHIEVRAATPVAGRQAFRPRLNLGDFLRRPSDSSS